MTPAYMVSNSKNSRKAFFEELINPRYANESLKSNVSKIIMRRAAPGDTRGRASTIWAEPLMLQPGFQTLLVSLSPTFPVYL